jgi:hypothetical protein
MGTPSAFFTIDGYCLKATQLQYRRGKFRREDRRVSWSHRRECVYVTSAGVLRKRLAEAGYDRTALESEFAKCVHEIVSSNAPESYFESRCDFGRYTTVQRVEACRQASLDDWLLALKEHMAIERRHFCYLEKPIQRNLPARIDALVEIIERPSSIAFQKLGYEDRRPTFPCRDLDCMAVAMLEVVPDSAECILDVTSLVDHGLVYCFEDLCSSTSSTADEEDDI